MKQRIPVRQKSLTDDSRSNMTISFSLIPPASQVEKTKEDNIID